MYRMGIEELRIQAVAVFYRMVSRLAEPKGGKLELCRDSSGKRGCIAMVIARIEGGLLGNFKYLFEFLGSTCAELVSRTCQICSAVCMHCCHESLIELAEVVCYLLKL